MIWHVKPRRVYGQWYDWLAWYPMRVGNTWIWFETIQKKFICCGWFGYEIEFRWKEREGDGR
jgi:hypothetical protein